MKILKSKFRLPIWVMTLSLACPIALVACSSDSEKTAEEGSGGESGDASGSEDSESSSAEGDTEGAPAAKGKAGEENLELNAEGGGDAEGGAGTPGIVGFVNPEKGVSVTTINWTKPIGQDNPGADCELRAAKKAGLYTCVVKAGPLIAILNIIEKDGHIAKLTLDGKGAATWKRWLKELKDNGYSEKKYKGPKKKGRTTMISSDGVSRADVVWVPAKKAVTIILKPAKGS